MTFLPQFINLFQNYDNLLFDIYISLYKIKCLKYLQKFNNKYLYKNSLTILTYFLLIILSFPLVKFRLRNFCLKGLSTNLYLIEEHHELS